MYSDYDKFAWIYNRHWGDNFTGEALYAFDRFVKDRIPANGSILDLCCGTGQLAKALSSKGYDVTGVDGSAEMLRFARKNAPKCRFIQAEVTEFKSARRFDAVVSAYDSLNHLMRLVWLKRAFRRVDGVLKKGGVFLFDLIMEEGFEARWRGSLGIVEEDHACVVRTRYDTKARVGKFDISIFLREKVWTRADLELEERCYRPEEVILGLKQAGFGKVGSFDAQKALKRREIGRTFGRTFFVAENQ
jgi:SAM-dependent methyltransferase